MIVKMYIIILTVLLFSCKKHDFGNWKIIEETFGYGCLVEQHSDSESKYYSFYHDEECVGEVYLGHYEFNKKVNDDLMRFIMFELPQNATSFTYSNEQIKDNLKIFAYTTETFRAYRNLKGTISGQKVDSVWQLSYSITFGGKKDDCYEIIKK